MGLAKIRDRCFWAKNVGAKVNMRQNGAFLDHFLNILSRFSQKVVRFFQKWDRFMRFLQILKKRGSFSRGAETLPQSRRKIRTYDEKPQWILTTYSERIGKFFVLKDDVSPSREMASTASSLSQDGPASDSQKQQRHRLRNIFHRGGPVVIAHAMC